MRLIACRLQNVRRHRELELEFGRSLTLITGANESGKSTLVEALHKGLFLRATATGRGVEELRSRLHAGLPEVEIRFEAGAECWRLRKRFAGASGTCQLSNASGVALSGAEAEERLAALLGYEAPVEGRRIAQLPERWAHLWVRQGDAGLNPLEGSQERYDHQRLIHQLQQQGSSGALESNRDRLVLEQIQQQVATLYTATGRVKAGSPLAEAQRRSQEAAAALSSAHQQVADLEAAMEQWRSINERLHAIDQRQRPALLRELDLEQRTQLLQAQLQPLLQQQQDQRQLQEQQHREQQEQAQLNTRLNALLQQQQESSKQRDLLKQQAQQLNTTLRQMAQRQELLQALLDRLQLDAEAEQLREHQRQLKRLQGEAETLKQQLAGLPEINADQVRQLRQAEQQLAQATARCEAMAAGIDVIQADQPVILNGETLAPGERRRIDTSASLQVGAGVRLEISPGGGQTLPQALEQQRSARQLLEQLLLQLSIQGSDQAEQIERQRQELERELSSLRQAAKAIPWSGLQQRLDQLAARRERLLRAIAEQQALLDGLGLGDTNPMHEEQLLALQEQLRATSGEHSKELERCNQQLHDGELNLQRQHASLEQLRSRSAQLEGSLQVLGQRLQRLDQQPLDQQALQSQALVLHNLQAELSELKAERRASAGGDAGSAAEQLQALEQEKDLLLSQRGQAEQRCQSLGAVNPIAELEQRQAAWEEADAERARIERRGEALQHLLQRFHAAQSALANRYSEPLRAAITPYLAAMARDPHQPLLGFDPQQGFQDLQLRQGDEAFAFERLSGGMREQLAAAVRLAMADVLKPAYADVLPLVFDDAFTNTDRDRLAGLRQMLERGLEQGIQIVLLTCHPDDYQPLLQPQRTQGTKNPPETLGGMEKGLMAAPERVLVALS